MLRNKLVLIGASTGGPGHLKKLLCDIKINSNIIVIAQHMDSMFIPSFCNQLAKECHINVECIENKIKLENKFYICKHNTQISKDLIASVHSDIKAPYSPNVDMLFSSAANLCENIEIMAILLTGIGDDGASGLLKLYENRAKCIAENEESAIIFGMPKRAKEINPNLKTMNLNDIRKELERFLYVF
ncbi:protein-glutamate methylesterase CheB [Campylobacter sputorum subsp. bubulus]|uniref:protein-glutamate methylesterase n=1 Tax=Campylobacter sputorum subsp. sputorum TaxID=32024 RepID=A0A381DL74_9BACT|nr:CheB methylesterase domain-containing protein [Campylobacter sputorum]ASM34673.1 MCP protein-glutamate methylesterase [Campylobacter sputorum aubsp. sputorum RM3237]KAB0581765.1 chemotaxis protein CheB [Campylobacter sputorum subsp. sputorum]QEL04864.1 MCP protein-glutamate methylesterase [Campylobacter sputorum subsp. sputorum]SUX09895.1 protein-glutamate methylesterase CheB [Campylobacter sputorum subsp. bubulus]SUX11350.1 protein-glutamate methylesterase CheB [Campylobacter sputorum subs